MKELRLSATCQIIKVGDTVSDIHEGINAGVWSVGVITGSSQMGVSRDEFNMLSKAEKAGAMQKPQEAFGKNGADFTINTIMELPGLIEKIDRIMAKGASFHKKAGLFF